ncbi:chloride channel protein [Roseibium denhamense]|uniref:Chloride channel protein, CIC family n=1 Tax=Roseibium denhamense TaxID=76305 RepID=A0ABY1NAU5_9HYPH|nr:chloride channel protein [Roseibium denhamense]MTI06541.1 chloride channel protein [Roseibium denhamense]SMP04816.1 chloride channel protein, CIC family [Roseibium denhamense]
MRKIIEAASHLPEILVSWITPNVRQYRAARLHIVWGLAIVIGLLVAAAAIAFRKLIGLFQLPWLGTETELTIQAAFMQPWWLIMLAPVFGGLLVGWILTKYHPYQRAGGVADVIEARAYGARGLPLKAGLWSALVTALSLGFGASAGREGPVVHLGATLGAAVTSKFNLPDSARRVLLGCAVASGVSASFNAPIAGVLFAHEVVLGHYAVSAFVPIVLASVMGTLLARLYFGDVAAFEIPLYEITSYWEIPAFALLGLTCALVAIIFQFALIGTDWTARNITMPLWLRPVIGGLAVGSIGVFYPAVLGVGYEATDLALKQELAISTMLILLVLKTAATAITLASRFGGGIFSPALYLGAMTGGAFGLIAASAFPEMASSHGLYAILGMGAVAAAVLGAPVSTTVIVFELTGGYALSIALLLAVSIATGLTQAVHGKSYFHWQLGMRGCFVNEGTHRHLSYTVKVREFMDPPPEKKEDRVFNPGTDGPYLHENDSLESALKSFDSCGKGSLPVVRHGDATRIIGIARHVRGLRYFNAALIKATKEEHE